MVEHTFSPSNGRTDWEPEISWAADSMLYPQTNKQTNHNDNYDAYDFFLEDFKDLVCALYSFPEPHLESVTTKL